MTLPVLALLDFHWHIRTNSTIIAKMTMRHRIPATTPPAIAATGTAAADGVLSHSMPS